MFAFTPANLRNLSRIADRLGRESNQPKQPRRAQTSSLPLHPSLQSWTARSRATSRTASGRCCPAGRTDSASRPLCRIAATPATTFWAPAPSPVRGTGPGIAPCPSACVSTSSNSCKWWYIYIYIFFFCMYILLYFSVIRLSSGALRPPQRAPLRPDLRWPSDGGLSHPLQLHQPARHHRQHNPNVPAGRPVERLTAALFRYGKTQLDCVWAKRDDPKIPLLLASSF